MTAGVHWLRFVTVQDVDSVLSHVASWLGESVVVLPYGFKGYRAGFQVGPVKVSAEGYDASMGVLVDVDGSGCEELGLGRLRSLYQELQGKATRLDVAIDGAEFSPADLRDAWRAGDVRTRCKVSPEAREDRQWRTSKWHSDSRGDTFTMGSRQSEQFGRCYDERGWTRFEMEWKGDLAPVVAAELLSGDLAGDAWMVAALSWVRRLVDFVDRDSSAHASRRALLPFWEAFLQGASKARLLVDGAVARTVEDVRVWLVRQAAPALALLEQALGMDALRDLVNGGRQRWGPRHLAMLRAAAVPS